MSTQRIYQCSLPTCRFRFPAPEGHPQASRCPRCGSPTYLVPLPGEDRSWNPRETEPPGPPVEALLDNIRSSFNVGAMFRTADGAALQHLHLAGTTPTPEHSGVSKTALGAEFSVPWTYEPNGVDMAHSLLKQGKRLWALEVGPQASSLYDALPERGAEPIVLVVGNEVAGIDPEISALCERWIWIPMLGFKRSLNVAIAFAVAVYTLRCTPLTRSVD